VNDNDNDNDNDGLSCTNTTLRFKKNFRLNERLPDFDSLGANNPNTRSHQMTVLFVSVKL